MKILAIMLLLTVAVQLQAQIVIPPDREGLLKGEGMGLALYAEVAGYPGPKHVLELKEKLKLTPDQHKKVEALADLVKVSAVAKGEEIVEAEEELFGLFTAGQLNEKTLRQKLEAIGKLRADLRFVHLQAHLRTRQVLTPQQVALYNELRGHTNNEKNQPNP
jgi:Spy/CpxP family protein refolding chaperone